MNYWKEEHQKAIELYYYCASASTSATTRNYLFNYILYNPFDHLITSALRSFNNPNLLNEDYKQDLFIYMYTKLLNKLKKDKLQGVLKFLYVSIKNHILSYIIIPGQRMKYEAIKDTKAVDNEAIKDIELKEVQKQIIQTIEKKIEIEKIINKSNTIYLILLKDYLINNQYDERGFAVYVMDKMNITLSTYRAISSRLDIRTKLFRKEL